MKFAGESMPMSPSVEFLRAVKILKEEDGAFPSLLHAIAAAKMRGVLGLARAQEVCECV